MSTPKIKKLFKTVFEACQDVKGENIVGLDLTKIESYADYILIVSGTSDRQVKALADRVVENAFKKCQTHPLGVEGYDMSQWVLIDFGDVVCHVFLDSERDLYRLEDMWHQVAPLSEEKIPSIFKSKNLPVKKPSKASKNPLKKKIVKK